MAGGGRVACGPAAVEQDELDHPLDADDVVVLRVMQVPAFDHARKSSGHVELAELDEELIVAA